MIQERLETYIMKHIALRSLSNRKIAPYTTPGLGDRLQACMIGYNYHLKHNTPVTLHLTWDKWGIYRDQKSDFKIKSWNEILSLFPKGSLHIEAHEVSNLQEVNWIKYLQNKGIDAQTYYYSDYTGPRDLVEGLDLFDASKYLKDYPCLKPIVNDLRLPERFVTFQFDSNGVPSWQDNSADIRKISPMKVEQIKGYYTHRGYDMIIVGGEAKGSPFTGIKEAGYAMSKASYHIGTDSGFFHLANLYMKPNQIRLYCNKGFYQSHHVLRAIDNNVAVMEIDI